MPRKGSSVMKAQAADISAYEFLNFDELMCSDLDYGDSLIVDPEAVPSFASRLEAFRGYKPSTRVFRWMLEGVAIVPDSRHAPKRDRMPAKQKPVFHGTQGVDVASTYEQYKHLNKNWLLE